MKWFIIIVVLTGVIAFWGCGGSNATGPSPWTTELEGTWVLVDSTEVLTFTFSDTNWTILVDSFTLNGTVTLNTTVTPKHIDLLCTGSTDTSFIGTTSLGIYALNSVATACTLAMNEFGDTSPRPIVFGIDYMIILKQ
ncbi:MAG: hypothetical protein KAR44_06135 [Candidatus Aegiribacteria sp.]|nr:hypothetical protein [Candidatus Aegiribacteria sp.]